MKYKNHRYCKLKSVPFKNVLGKLVHPKKSQKTAPKNSMEFLDEPNFSSIFLSETDFTCLYLFMYFFKNLKSLYIGICYTYIIRQRNACKIPNLCHYYKLHNQ